MDKVKEFATRFRITYPILFDCGQAAAALLKVTPENPKADFPHLFLVDSKGMIREDFDWVLDEAALTGNGLFESIDKILASPGPRQGRRQDARKGRPGGSSGESCREVVRP